MYENLHDKNTFLIFFLNLCFADKEFKPLPEKVKLISLDITKIDKINNIQLNIKLLNPDIDGLGSLLDKAIQESRKKPKVIRKGYSLGKFRELKSGDSQSLVIAGDNGDESFLCTSGCEKLGIDKNELSTATLLVLWNELDTGESVSRKESVDIYINTEKGQKFYLCELYSKLPVLEEGCEGEGCGILRYDKVIKDVNVFESVNFSAKSVGELKRCEKINDFKSHLSIESLGWVEVVKANEHLKKIGVKSGSIIPMIKSLGEGYLTACVNNILIDAVDFLDGSEMEIATVKRLVDNRVTGWSSVKLSNGKRGFIPDSSNFYMGYYDYTPESLYPEDHPPR